VVMATVNQQDKEVWREGFISGLNGETMSANPYPEDVVKRQEWLYGLVDGQEELKAAERERRPLRLPP